MESHFERIQSSSVARGGRGDIAPPIGLKSMQNTLLLALVRPIFALKTKIASHWLWQWELVKDLMWFRPEKLGFSLAEDLFFGNQLNLDTKTDSIWLKTDQNLGQNRLMLIPASKTALPIANS